tara:strand:- start:125 stop:820 length:696 start_codon:yes stop_codon:yes gene_type:complete
MATAVQFRRGTTSEHSSFTGLEGEITVDTTKDTVVVHDGSTAGGIPLAKESDVSTVATAITTTDESSDTTCFPLLSTDATGNLAAKTDASSLTYNASNGTLSATTFSGSLSGNATGLVGTANITTVVNSTNQTASNFYGQRMIHTGGAVDYTFAETGSISGTDIGKSVVVVNGGTADITCNITTSKFYKMISGIDTSYSGSGASSITISKGGVVEFIVSEQNKVLVLGSGI